MRPDRPKNLLTQAQAVTQERYGQARAGLYPDCLLHTRWISLPGNLAFGIQTSYQIVFKEKQAWPEKENRI